MGNTATEQAIIELARARLKEIKDYNAHQIAIPHAQFDGLMGEPTLYYVYFNKSLSGEWLFSHIHKKT